MKQPDPHNIALHRLPRLQEKEALMRQRIDPLIGERAPWLLNDNIVTRNLRRGLDSLLSYRKTLQIAAHMDPLSAQDIMRSMAQLLARQVEIEGLAHLPRHGAALIVANHPTGIADGIMLNHAIAKVRDDCYFYANSDILRVLPQFDAMIAPVEWREEKRSHAKTRITMNYTRQAVQEGRLGVIFPSGRLAKRRGLSLHEREWMASAAMIARKFDLPIIPVNIRARNSVLFYLFDLIHPSLRDITLFHETLNKTHQPYHITFGHAVQPEDLPGKSSDAIATLRDMALGLGGRHAPCVSLIENSSRPTFMREPSY